VFVAPEPLAAGPHVISLLVPSGPIPTRLFADGAVVATGEGLAPHLTTTVQLGAFSSPWPAEVGEVIVFAGILPPGERLLVEQTLAGKWRNHGPMAADSDADGLPDWWEWEAATNPALADADADADLDGLSNLAAFQQARCGFVWNDQDRDGLHDRWESTHGLNPLVDDSALDPDRDRLTNAFEHALGTDPSSPDDPPDAWGILPLDGTVPRQFEISHWSNHRSWRSRVALERSSTLHPDSWDFYATPASTASPRSGVTRSSFPPLGPNDSTGAAFFRLRLADE
jgi:hypothetical protein